MNLPRAKIDQRPPQWLDQQRPREKMGVLFEDLSQSNMISLVNVSLSIYPMMFERDFLGYNMVYHNIPNFQTIRHIW